MCSNKEKEVLILCCGGSMKDGGMVSSGEEYGCAMDPDADHELGGSWGI